MCANEKVGQYTCFCAATLAVSPERVSCQLRSGTRQVLNVHTKFVQKRINVWPCCVVCVQFCINHKVGDELMF